MSAVEKQATTMGPDRRTEEDPDNAKSTERDLVMPQVVVAMGDGSSDEDASDDEEEEPDGDGYMLLPEADQDIDHAENEMMMDYGEFATAPSSHQQQQQQQEQQLHLPPHLSKLMPTEAPAQDPSTVVSFTDTAESLEDRRQVMAADDEIQKAMAGFALPGTAIPPWARALGDKEWKEQLTTMIRGRDEKVVDTSGTSKEGEM